MNHQHRQETKMNMNHHEFKALRSYHGLSINQLSEYLGTHERTLRRWENGTAPIPPGLEQQFITLERHRTALCEQLELGVDPIDLIALTHTQGIPEQLIYTALGEILIDNLM